LNAGAWDRFFEYQAAWGREAREFVYRHTEIFRARNILELGCGTGVITRDIVERTMGNVYAVDINRDFLAIAEERCRGKNVKFICMDAHALEFEDHFFDAVYFANFLMWVQNPDRVFSEIARVLADHGFVGILSEPDYGGRIDYPCTAVREKVIADLRSRGANPYTGRRIRELCVTHGLDVNLQCLQGVFAPEKIAECYGYEELFVSLDEETRRCIETAIKSGTAFLSMPIIYGYAWVKKC